MARILLILGFVALAALGHDRCAVADDTSAKRAASPAANVWVAAEIDWKKTLANFREAANWVASDGYSDKHLSSAP